MIIAVHETNYGIDCELRNVNLPSNITIKKVNAYSSNIINELRDCNAFVWHHHHNNPKDVKFAKQLLLSVEKMGLIVFPDFNSGWHFDDKVAQKYLLEAVNAPLVPSYVFYDKTCAIQWANSVIYPKVFKLRGGAGASNVHLVNTPKEAFSLIKKSFGKGFSQFNRIGYLKDTLAKWCSRTVNVRFLFSGFYRLFRSTPFEKSMSKEKGYVYFQEFIPDNLFDIRVIIINNKAFGLKRMVRKGDFRASGSGLIIYDPTQIDERCIRIAFETSKKLNASCLAYDFVFDVNNVPLIVEISYGFTHQVYKLCEGYWNENLKWFNCPVDPCKWIFDDLINKLNSKS